MILFFAGVLVGAIIGVFLMALMNIASREDRMAEKRNHSVFTNVKFVTETPKTVTLQAERFIPDHLVYSQNAKFIIEKTKRDLAHDMCNDLMPLIDFNGRGDPIQNGIVIRALLKIALL